MRRASEPGRATALWRRLEPRLLPLAGLLVLVATLPAGPRVALVAGAPALLAGVLAARAGRGVRAATAALLAVLALGAGAIAQSVLLVAAGALALLVAVRAGWGVNRGRPRRRAWAIRAGVLAGAIVVGFLVVYPTLLAVLYLAKPRDAIDQSALGLPHERVTFPASDGVRLAGWYVPPRNGAAIVVVHGGGGDRQGAVRHARMLAGAGYGVLLYDARGRGESGGDENAFGWLWDRDVRGAVDLLERRGVHRVGLLGLSTGAEVVVTEAAGDPRVGAVVADGLQGRTWRDASVLPLGDRVSIEPVFAVLGAEIRLARGEPSPPPLRGLVERLSARAQLLLIATVSFEREADRADVRGTRARLWELPDTPHTEGLERHPRAYRRRVLAVFRAL